MIKQLALAALFLASPALAADPPWYAITRGGGPAHCAVAGMSPAKWIESSQAIGWRYETEDLLEDKGQVLVVQLSMEGRDALGHWSFARLLFYRTAEICEMALADQRQAQGKYR